MWTCKKCHEELEDAFDTCWSCGTERSSEAVSPYRTPSPEAIAPSPEKGRASGRGWTCPVCGSRDHIPDARVVEYGDRDLRNDLHVEIYEKPDAILFKGTTTGKLRGTICAECGYTALFVQNPKALYQAYRRSQAHEG